MSATLLIDPRRDDGLWVIGHRGAAGLAPENTLAGFAHAVRLGVDAVELDVRLSVEKRLVVIHDERLDRTTNGTGAVAVTPFDALRRLDAGAGERIPTLDEILDAVPAHVAVNIELKGRATAAAVARTVAGRERPLLVSAFDHDELARFHDLCPAIPCAPLLARWRRGVVATAHTLGAWSVNLADRIADTATVDAVLATGRHCLVYTVNDAERAAALRAMGVTGVFTDFPDRLLGPDSGRRRKRSSGCQCSVKSKDASSCEGFSVPGEARRRRVAGTTQGGATKSRGRKDPQIPVDLGLTEH